MAERKQVPIFESCYRITQYLKKHTDKDHPTTQAEMRKDSSVSEYLGAKETSNSYINQIALALNSNEKGVLEKDKDWKVVFDAFTEVHSSKKSKRKSVNYVNEDKLPIRNLYYNHEFTTEEIDKIIECISFSDTIDDKTSKSLIDKIKSELTSVYYVHKAPKFCKVENEKLVDGDIYRRNLTIIQTAIDNNVKITFYYNGVGEGKKLERVSTTKEVISPYYLVLNKDKYYVVACKDSFMGKAYKKNMSIWRVDLMDDIKIPGKMVEKRFLGETSTPKREVQNLPEKWNNDFHFSHLNMACDEPVEITFKLISPSRVDDISRSNDYLQTFLFDTFGTRYDYKETKSGDEIVTVTCSPSEMVNWSLLHSDRVEILTPEFLRYEVKEKVRKLNKIYMD